jgi:signal transduction histidine kinase
MTSASQDEGAEPTNGDNRGLLGDQPPGAGAAAVDGLELRAAIRELLNLAQNVLAELDLDVVLERVLAAARELTGAQYAALGVLNKSRTGLERFVSAGLGDSEAQAIGAPPQGDGVLGQLIRDPRPLRLADIGQHPSSFGFPPGHPSMQTFLGVPILVAGQPFGSLYLTEKRNREDFTARDEEALVVLAELAGLAIDHAHRYTHSEIHRGELQRAVDALDATVQVSRALAGQTDLDKVLQLVARRAQALISARALVIELREREDVVVGAVAGEVGEGVMGQRLRLKNSVANAAMMTATTQRLEDEPNRSRFEEYDLGRLGVHPRGGLVVPLTLRGRAYGVLVAVDPLGDDAAFTAHDQQLLEWFAASAATCVVSALVVSAERERERLAAFEHERGRWARELHEGTLQRLAGLRIELASARGARNLDTLDEAVATALAGLRSEMGALRSLSFELRPSVLDEFGTEAAISALVDIAEQHGVAVELYVDLADEQAREPVRHTAELETAMYRIVQEALSNIQNHAHAAHASVTVKETEDLLELIIRDDGRGFDAAEIDQGFGLPELRDRIELLDGKLRIDSSLGHGTTVHATLPARRRPAADERG